MKLTLIKILPPIVAALVGVVLVLLWQGGGAGIDLLMRLPAIGGGADKAKARQVVDIEGFFAAGQGAAAKLPGSWPKFRGAGGDAISKETVPLVRSFGGNFRQRERWSIELGEGYAGPAIVNGRVYLLDYDQRAKADVLRCLSLADGREIWRRGYYVQIKRNHGMSRTVPAVSDGFVVTLGPKCHVMCTDAVTGEYLWGIDLVGRYGTRVPDWYAGQCPLIDDGKAIIAPAGDALMIAVDCRTGEVLWEAPNPSGWRMTHSSIMPMTVAGRRMYVYCGSGGVAGVDAETGQVLWTTREWTVNMANCPSPVMVGDGRIFLSGGYGSGSMMIRIVERDGQFSVEELFRLPAKVFGSEQQTPVLYDGYIYGIRQDGQLVCLDLDGQIAWASGRNSRFGSKGRGPVMIADGMLVILTSEGMLSLVEPSPAGLSKLAETRVLTGGEAWAPMAIAGGRLLLRDLTRMICLDMRASAQSP